MSFASLRFKQTWVDMMETEVEEAHPGEEGITEIRGEVVKAIKAASMVPPGPLTLTLINSMTVIHIVRGFMVGIFKVLPLEDMAVPRLVMVAEITDTEAAAEVVDAREISVMAMVEGGEATVTITRAVEVEVVDAREVEDVVEVAVAENHVQTSKLFPLF